MDRLSLFRDRLNEIDGEIIALLGRRLDVCREIGHYKKDQGLPIGHPEREEGVKARCAALAEERGVSPQLARQLYELIIAEASRLQERIIEEEKSGGEP